MAVQFIGPAALYFARKGVKGYIKYRNALKANKKLVNKQKKGKELSGKDYDDFQSNKNIYTKPDKHTLKTEKKYLGKKVNKGYISKKTGLIPKKRNGGSIKVKCKLGRNRPTKLY
tara:strand:- start:14 stop:358 length:345 start_codon:yes stop_codon:yes gene_type:complete